MTANRDLGSRLTELKWAAASDSRFTKTPGSSSLQNATVLDSNNGSSHYMVCSTSVSY